MEEPSGSPMLPLEQARIVGLELLNEDFAIVVFSNGDAVKLELAKVRHLALTSGTEYISARHADSL